MGRQVFPRTILDPIHSHDGTPAVAIYRAISDTIKCPLFSYQVYDISPHTSSKAHAMTVAVLLHEGTVSKRLRREFPQRIDVYSFPLPADMSQDERVEKCIAHQKAEIAARMRTGKRDFFMQSTFSKEDHQRIFFIIDSSMEKFEETGFLTVDFDLKVKNEHRDEDDQMSEIYVWRTKDMSGWYLNPEDARAKLDGRPPVMEALGLKLSQVEDKVQWFYETYVLEGLIDNDLRKAKES